MPIVSVDSNTCLAVETLASSPLLVLSVDSLLLLVREGLVLLLLLLVQLCLAIADPLQKVRHERTKSVIEHMNVQANKLQIWFNRTYISLGRSKGLGCLLDLQAPLNRAVLRLFTMKNVVNGTPCPAPERKQTAENVRSATA